MSAFAPSPYQQAVFDALANPKGGSLLVNAKAGSGKTTTIIEGLEQVPANKSILMLAFNKSIQQELASRVPSGVQVATFHSVGFRAWKYYTGKKAIKVDSDKLWKLARDMWTRDDVRTYGSFCTRMVGLGKNAGIGTYLLEDLPGAWEDLMYHFDVFPQSEEADIGRAIQLCSQLLRGSADQDRFTVDFDDMLYAPLRERATFKRFDLVFIDEAQDTNTPQRELLKRMIAPGGRLVAVGDPYQAIYGFRGADSAAMSKIKEDFGCTELPLSISYRCAQSVIREAQAYVPDIEAFEHAAEGSVNHLDVYTVDSFGPDDAVLCRNVAPLVDLAYGMVGRGRGVNFLGREIGKNLINLIKKMDAGDVDELEIKLTDYRDREEKKLRAKGKESAIEALNDKVECLYVCINHLSENERTIDSLISAIDDLFSKKHGRLLTLCTVHKSKGMEWNRVFILDRWRMPSKYATQPWQQEQEQNLIYVAITRAKRELTYIDGKCWKD